MMEVKHSPNVPLLDYVSANSDSNSADTSALLKNASISKQLQSEKLEDELLQNGASIDDELDFQDAADEVEQINSDLEDALLADDDLLTEPKTHFSLENLDKAENSTDPGDDLDRLLSKINDVVDGSDLIGKEVKAEDNKTKKPEQVNDKSALDEKKHVEESTNESKEEVKEDLTAEIEPMEIDEDKEQSTSKDIDEDIIMKETPEKISESPLEKAFFKEECDKTVDEKKADTVHVDKQMMQERKEKNISDDVCPENEDQLNKADKETKPIDEPMGLKSSINPSSKKKIYEPAQEPLEADEMYDKDEILTLVIDDDDDANEEVPIRPTETTTAKAVIFKSDKKVNQDEEIVCLDDDDVEAVSKTGSELEIKIPAAETENKAHVNHKNDIEVSVTKKNSEKGSKNESRIKNLERDTEDIVTKSEEKCKIDETDTYSKLPKVVTQNADKAIEKESKKKDNVANITETFSKEIDMDLNVSANATKLDKSSVKINETVISLQLKNSVTETESAGFETMSKNQNNILNRSESNKDVESKKEKSTLEAEIKVSESKTENKELESLSKDRDESGISKGHVMEGTQAVSEKSAVKQNDLISDNTDNACDGLENAKTTREKPAEEAITPIADDARSDSSGSNLLQEGQAPSEHSFEERDEAEDDDAEGEVEDGNDVEMVEGNLEKAAENGPGDDDIEIPPAKRLRLSTDSESNNKNKNKIETKKTDLKEIQKHEPLKEQAEGTKKPKDFEEIEVDKVKEDSKELTTDDTTSVTTYLKRALSDASETEGINKTNTDGEKNVQCASKKQKTNTEEPDTVAKGSKVQEKSDLKTDLEKLKKPEEDVTKTVTDETTEVKPHIVVPSNKPIPLYPPPKFEETPQKLSLDFLQRFRKSFNQMTKNDLEELVLQKVVEALVYENQFSDLRLIIEKQEKVIAMHRSKLAQLVKQYRDLEMVHTRVVKDMREKNSQYLMPVRITRAVGLQVSSPTVRKPDGQIAQSTTSSVAGANLSTAATGIMRAPQTIQQQQQQQKRLASPQRPQANNTLLPSSTSPTAPAVATAASSSTAQPVRRGCMQKVTAQRPVNGSTNVSSSTNPPMASIPASSYSRSLPVSKTAQTPVADNGVTNVARVLNKIAQGVTPNSRLRYSSGNINNPSPVQQAKSPPQALNRQPVSVNNAASKINTVAQNKPGQPTQLRRSESSPTVSNAANASKANTSATYMEQYKNSFNQAMPTVSITPARPKDKSVIDLTDEDDVPPPPSMTPRTRVAPQAQVNANNAANSNNRQNLPPSLTRMPSGVSVRPQIAARQLSTMQTQKNALQQQSTTITTASGMSITRVTVNQANPAAQRLRYTHPAALPPTPPQTFNPGWKLPPPRPTIRISNLDNGIVISWTMEETLDRHAEVTTYQIYAYQETNAAPSTDSWRHVGDVKAMLLPMAVTLTQFQEDQRYFFSVRAMDVHQRYGPFSAPKTWN